MGGRLRPPVSFEVHGPLRVSGGAQKESVASKPATFSFTESFVISSTAKSSTWSPFATRSMREGAARDEEPRYPRAPLGTVGDETSIHATRSPSWPAEHLLDHRPAGLPAFNRHLGDKQFAGRKDQRRKRGFFGNRACRRCPFFFRNGRHRETAGARVVPEKFGDTPCECEDREGGKDPDGS